MADTTLRILIVDPDAGKNPSGGAAPSGDASRPPAGGRETTTRRPDEPVEERPRPNMRTWNPAEPPKSERETARGDEAESSPVAPARAPERHASTDELFRPERDARRDEQRDPEPTRAPERHATASTYGFRDVAKSGEAAMQPGERYEVRPPVELPKPPAPAPPADAKTIDYPDFAAEIVTTQNKLVVDTAVSLGKLREANEQLRDSLSDGTYLAQQKEAVALRKEEADLGKEAARAAKVARYGERGADRMERADKAAAFAPAAAEFAAGNNARGVGMLADKAAAGLEELGPAGRAAAASLRAVTTTVRAFDKVTIAFVERGKYLAAYSGELAGANARAQVRSTLADVREARRLESPVARITEASSKTQDNLRELFLPLKEIGANLFAVAGELIQALTGLAKLVAPLFNVVAKAVQVALWPFKKILEGINTVLDKLWDLIPNVFGPKPGELNELMQQVLGLGDNPGAALGPDPAAQAARARLAFPVLGFE